MRVLGQCTKRLTGRLQLGIGCDGSLAYSLELQIPGNNLATQARDAAGRAKWTAKWTISRGSPKGQKRHENERTIIVAILDHNKGSMLRNDSSKKE